jgi:nicotinamide-nucleotide amidase
MTSNYAPMDVRLVQASEMLLNKCSAAGLLLATAESCTGGLIAACLTEVAGSSNVVDCGFVTYSNEAKMEMLGVPAGLLEEHGAVSEAVVRAMAEGAIARSRADISIAVSGIAGPGGGSPEKSVGLVHFAAARRDGETVHLVENYGNAGRGEVRARTVSDALILAGSLV